MTDVLEHYQDHGYAIVRNFLPDDLIDAYVEARGTDERRWTHPTPYMHELTILDLCCYRPLTEQLARSLGESPVLHLNLTGFRSTQRAWHQDGYLNPPEVGDFYVAVWMALDEIHEDSGPFEMVPDSHKWDTRLSREDAYAMGTEEQRAHPDWHRMWPSWTEDRVAAFWEEEIGWRQASVQRFWPAHKGDVLFWHPWLVHRGSVPVDPHLERRALISHFSGAKHRDDMKLRDTHNGALYAVLPTDGKCS